MSIFAIVDDKYVPLYRVIWVAATPHFCGADDCEREGHYEVRLEQGESVWAKTLAERDGMLDPATELLREAFDMLEEDFEEERFFATVRRAFWQAPEGSGARRVAETLIRRLEF